MSDFTYTITDDAGHVLLGTFTATMAIAAAAQRVIDQGKATRIRTYGRVRYGVDLDGTLWVLDDSGVPSTLSRRVSNWLGQAAPEPYQHHPDPVGCVVCDDQGCESCPKAPLTWLEEIAAQREAV